MIIIILKKMCPEACHFKLYKTTFMKIFENEESIQLISTCCETLNSWGVRCDANMLTSWGQIQPLHFSEPCNKTYLKFFIIRCMFKNEKKLSFHIAQNINCKNVTYFLMRERERKFLSMYLLHRSYWKWPDVSTVCYS